MLDALTGAGATVLTCTFGDPVPINPYARVLRKRLNGLNVRLRESSARYGAVLVDFGREPVVSDSRFWCEDRLHANTEGHRRIALAFAEALGVPVEGPRWNEPLPAGPAQETAGVHRRRVRLGQTSSRPLGRAADSGTSRRATGSRPSCRSSPTSERPHPTRGLTGAPEGAPVLEAISVSVPPRWRGPRRGHPPPRSRPRRSLVTVLVLVDLEQVVGLPRRRCVPRSEARRR